MAAFRTHFSTCNPRPKKRAVCAILGPKIVSASHNFFNDQGGRDQVIRSWGATRFGFRDDSLLERVESMNEAARRSSQNVA